MSKIWLVISALFLAGCTSNRDSTPETATAPPAPSVVQPQVLATTPPPVVQAPAPPAPSTTSPVVQSPSQTIVSEQPQQSDDTKRQQVASLRLEISSLQNQRRAVEQQKAQFGSRRPNADPNERATGASSPDDAMMANYNQRLDMIDSQIASKQKQIDDIMMSR